MGNKPKFIPEYIFGVVLHVEKDYPLLMNEGH